MYSNNYNFTCVNAVKIILKNQENKILLVQEPKTNDWMPLHWGLPGGKATETESLLETFKRKSISDIGQNLTPSGIVKIEELLMNGKTVLMFVVLAETTLSDVKGEGANYKWVSYEDINNMHINDFTEFYNKDLLSDYFNGNYVLIPFTAFKTSEYYKMGDDFKYQSWLQSCKAKQ
jgi:ADP-ribose pyrophosphatase YjhB (NUDIX family)